MTDISTVQQMTKDACVCPLSTAVHISSDTGPNDMPKVHLGIPSLFFFSVEPHCTLPHVDHLTYSHPSAHHLVNQDGTDTSTNWVHTCSTWSTLYIFSQSHESRRIHLPCPVFTIHVGPKGIVAFPQFKSLTKTLWIPGMVHQPHTTGCTFQWWQFLAILMIPDDHKPDSGVSYTPPQYIIHGVQQPPVQTNMTNTCPSVTFITGCAAAGHNAVNITL